MPHGGPHPTPTPTPTPVSGPTPVPLPPLTPPVSRTPLGPDLPATPTPLLPVAPPDTPLGLDPTSPASSAATDVGQVPPLNPDDFWVKWDSAVGGYVPARPGERGAVFDDEAYSAALKSRQDIAAGFPGGRTGPTAAELAIERSKVHAQNLATFVNGTVAELELEIQAGQLETNQAIAEFDRRMDAFTEGGKQFQGILPYTIPIGAEYAPGFGPGEVGERLGIDPRRAEVVQFDPFAMAADIVAQTPTITDIGVPSGDALAEALAQAEQFVGG